MAKASASKPAAPAKASKRAVALTEEELHQTRELLESVMTIAAHGILYRVGRILGERLVADAKLKGGNFTDAASALMVERGWVTEITFFHGRAQAKGSLEAKAGPEPTCHILRGLVHAVAMAEGGAMNVREEECASAGAAQCTFVVQKGGKSP